MVDANELARQTLAEARERRLIETAERNDNPPPPISTYAGFDCKTGEALLRPVGGGIVRGQPLYNTAVRPGDIMDLHVSQGLPKADSLSAWEPEPVPVVEEEREVFGKIKILFADSNDVIWIGGDRANPKQLGAGWASTRSFPASAYNFVNLGDGDRYLVTENRSGLFSPPEDGFYTVKRWGRQRDLVIEDTRNAAVDSILRTGLIIGNGAIRALPFQFLTTSGGSNFSNFIVPGLLSVSTFGDAFTGIITYSGDSSSSALMFGASTPFYFGITGNYGGNQSLAGSASSQFIPESPSRGSYFENSEASISLNGDLPIGRITVNDIYQYNQSAFNSGNNAPPPLSNDAITTIQRVAISNIFCNTSDSVALYSKSEYTADLVGSVRTVVSFTKTWLHQSSGLTEVKPPSYRPRADNIGIGPTTGEMTMIGTVFYEARYGSYTPDAVSEMTVYVHELRDQEYVETRNFNERVYPIPENVTILRWSYHP